MTTASAAPQTSVDRGRYGPQDRSPWHEIDWREHQRWLRAEGAVVNAVDIGAGPALVWIHGLGGSWQNWLEQLPVFAAGFRCVAMDLPGFGASPLPPDDLSIPGYGRVVAALMRELGIGSAVLVGNSMGGFIGAEVAIQFPDLVDKLVLVSAAGISSESVKRRPLVLGAHLGMYGATWVAAHAEHLVRRPRAKALIGAGIFRAPWRLPGPLLAEQAKGAGTEGFVDALDALLSYRIRERIPEISCPTLVVWGRQDRVVPVRDADAFEQMIPDARKVIFDKTGHVPMLERPEAFNRVVREFLHAKDAPPEEI